MLGNETDIMESGRGGQRGSLPIEGRMTELANFRDREKGGAGVNF